MVSGNATIQKSVPGKNGTTQTRYAERFRPRTIKDIPAGAKYLAGPMGQSNAPDYINVIQSALRDVGVRWAMPEYMVSGDASNGNYSSTLVAESPFVKSATVEQKVNGKKYKLILWQVIRNACEAGVIKYNYRDVCKLIDINVEYPDIAARNLLDETTRREKEHAAGVLSLRTWAKESGRDFDAEQENRSKEPKPASPFGMGGEEDPNSPFFQRMQPGAMRGAIQGAIEEAEDPLTLKTLLMEAANWDESKHPRADDGKFISVGEIKAAQSDPEKAKELREKTTNPEERKKLDAVLKDKSGGLGAIIGATVDKVEEKAAKGKILPLTQENIASTAKDLHQKIVENWNKLKKIREMPGTRESPFPRIRDSKHPAWEYEVDDPPDLPKKVHDVPVDKLVTPQSYVDASGVKSKLKEMKRGIKEAIQVLVHNGQYVILDGNHRATAAWVRGDKTIPADLYKYENGEFGVYEP
jgi:hypothetical protein